MRLTVSSRTEGTDQLPNHFILGTGVEEAGVTVNRQLALCRTRTEMFHGWMEADNAAGRTPTRVT